MQGRTNAGGTGGFGLNLKIVNGATMPSNPRENTVWVKTTVAIKSYALSVSQPEIGTEGLLWLKTAYTGIEINVGKKNDMLISLAMAKIYSNGEWATLKGYVYKEGSWVQFGFLALYKDGDFTINHKTLGTNGSIVYSDTYYTVTQTGGGKKSEVYEVFGPLSLTGIATITMRCDYKKLTPNAYINLAILVANTDTSNRSNAASKSELYTVDTGEHTITLDVSSLSGDGWYVYAGTNTQGSAWSDKRTTNVLEVSLA